MATARDRLARYVIRDRTRLYRSRKAFADAAGVSTRTIDKIETGADVAYRPATVARLEAALRWADGSVARVLSGGRPRPEPDPQLAELLSLWPGLSRDARRMLLRLARDASRD